MNDLDCVDSAISELLDLRRESCLTSSMKDQIEDLLSGLQFLGLYAQCSTKWNEALQGKKNRHLGSVRNPQIKATLGGATKGLYSTGINALKARDFQDWDNLASNLLEKIQLCLPKIKEDCLELLDCTFQCRFSSSELQKFFRSLFDSLDQLLWLKAEFVGDVNIQIEGIKGKLRFFAQIFDLSRKIRRSNKDLKDFNVRIQAWAYNAACLSLLYWVQDGHQEGEIPARMRIFLSTPEITRMFLAVLKYLWSSSHDCLLKDEGVPKFVDFLLEILQLNLVKLDGIQSLQSELMFLSAFLVDPPMAKEYREDAEFIANEVQSLLCSLSANQLSGGTAEDRDILLHNFQENMNTLRAKVRELYARILLDSSSFDFPRINVLGFIDSVRDNLKEFSLCVTNHQVEILQVDLLSLGSFLRDILIPNMELYEDLYARIVNVVYRVEIAVNMLLYLKDCVWFDMKFLSRVRDEINLIKSKVGEIEIQERANIRVLTSETRSSPIQSRPNQTTMARMDEVIVGFEDDSTLIIDQLIRGSSRLKVVSIVGMPGQGKTSLVRMVYNHYFIASHFHKRTWCSVSQRYQRRNLMLDILSEITVLDDIIFEMEEEDIAERIYKHLKMHRYLIVMDDIWDIKVWNDLRYLFPDDNNGSRILLTSRIHDVALYAGRGVTPYSLRPLSHQESWKLLQRKLFHEDDCPPNFREVGYHIARNCNGLPLAIIVVAGLLSMEVNSLDWWEQIADNLDSLIASQVSMSVAELSYRHLPEFLKPPFLYFGAFQPGKVIRVRRLLQLWISEGFIIDKSGSKSLEDVAEDYLIDLVSRSLVVATNKSSTGRIKACQVHGLFYELCLAKGKEEKFLQVESGTDLFSNSKDAIYKNYRVCIQSGGDGFFASNPSGPCVHSLLFVPDHTSLRKGELFSICNFILLKVLDLEDVELNGYFPEEVMVLVLLRYLAIWCPNGKLSIPPSIANLSQLESFRVKREVRVEDEIFLPHTMWTMKRLRHVDVGGFTTSFSGPCKRDEESLALDNIHTFSAPYLCYGEDAESLLRRLPNVRKLRCRFLDSCDPYQKRNHFPVLDGLSQLESLNVRYLGSLFYPCALKFPSTLKKLSLAKFKLPWSEMSTIGKLPNLEVLKLLEAAFDGKIWNMEDVIFPSLKFLKFRELNIAQWIINEDEQAFPCLEQLIVENCDELEEIPLTIADTCFTLKKIQVRWCKPTVASSVQQIQDEMGNEEFEALIEDIF